VPVPPHSFADLCLLPSLIAGLESQGLTRPMPIQATTVPALLEGRSLVGVSETGSGKTLAFVLPMLHQLKSLETSGSSVAEASRPRGLVLVPSRELGDQVSKVFKTLTHSTRLRVRTALGGSRKQVARQNVQGLFEILVATPGRLVQLLDRSGLRLDDVRMLVCDEADQLLDPGFLTVVQRALSCCPDTVQLVLFSATLPKAMDAVLGGLFPVEPLRVVTPGSSRLVATLRTDNRRVIDGRRFDILSVVLAEEPDVGTLLFVNTREQCERVADWLRAEGIAHASYRGEMDRVQRRTNLRRFRAGEIRVLVATDLGGRGLDIDQVQRVVNVHLPREIDNYLHRAGRTARAGRDGVVVNLVTERDAPLMAEVSRRGALP